MALGRISGPLLKANLLRNTEDIAFETNLLYLNVNTHAADVADNPLDPSLWTGKIGVKTDAPLYDVDINGTLRAINIIATEVDIGDLNIFENVISTVSPDLPDITIRATVATGRIILDNPTDVSGDLAVNGENLTTTSETFNLLNDTATTVNFAGAAEVLSIGALTGTTTINNDAEVTGDLAINGGDITSTATDFNLLTTNVTTLTVGSEAETINIGALTGTTTINNDAEVTGDLAINGGDITSTATDFNLLNDNVSTVNFAGEASTINIGSALSTTTINYDLIVSADLSVNGGDITSTATEFNLLNDTVTTVNFAGEAETISIGSASGTTTVNNELVASLNLSVNGGNITTTASEFNLLNDTATTVNFASDAVSINIGAASGTTTVNNSLEVTSDLTVNSNTTIGNSSANTLTITSELISSIIPQLTGLYDLGSTDKAWRSLFVTDTINVANIKISDNLIESTDTDGDITLTPNGTGKVIVNSNLDVTGDITLGGNIVVGDQPLDTITINADFTSDLIPDVTGTYDLGTSAQRWDTLFVNNLDVAIPPKVFPIVHNILYVTTDGSDTNDGRTFDASGACRTIGGALKSPYYGPGTSIKVSPGRYLEDNPLVLKPYTSIIGSDLRTTSVEPINKTQDLFHVNSSCYIAQMQFYNGRSGIVDPNRDRGAYSISFPTTNGLNFTGDIVADSYQITNISSISILVIGMEIFGSGIPNGARVKSIDSDTQVTLTVKSTATNTSVSLRTGKIDVYKSPYIQNCTNQSGPWLYDGTMFVPNQTVQVPIAVGVTTFDDSETSISVTITRGASELVSAVANGDSISINTAPQDQGFFNARTLLLANKQFVQEQIIEYITQQVDNAPSNSIWYNFTYQKEKCYRDVGIIIENILYDSTFGGNSKSVESGLAYFNGVISVIAGEISQTVAALEYIKTLVPFIVTNQTAPDLITDPHFEQVKNIVLTNGNISVTPIANNIDIIINIIQNGPLTAPTVYYSTGVEFGLVSAEILMQANRAFIQKEISAYVDSIAPIEFVYNKSKCERDVGLIVDAISQDLLIGGNAKSIEAAKTYYLNNKSVIPGEESLTALALMRAKAIILDIIQNTAVTITPGNVSNILQITKSYFSRGEIAGSSISRNLDTIADIVVNGLAVTPVSYSGSGLFSATGISADDVQESTKILSITNTGGNNYIVTLSKPTVGIGNNSTLYFGYTDVYPKIDTDIPTDWPQRKVDPWGSVGGMLVDGGVISDISPINSMVMDAYTQVNQGGRGIRITNNGYAQLVSVFTIFCSIAVQVDNGGICSITNSNSNFGDYCLLSKGYGKREFYGTIYNPADLPLYPNGRYPNRGTIAVYIPDISFRPHIALVMEVEPPKTYVNAQAKPGFLSSTINLSSIVEGTLTLTDIDNSGMSIGQTVYIRDQFGRFIDPITELPYVKDNTVIIDLGYRSVTFNQPINVSASDINNPDNSVYFTLFTAGKAYYTVLSSELLDPPKPLGSLILPSRGSDNVTQGQAEVGALNYLKSMMQSVVTNALVSPRLQTEVEQVRILSLSGGSTTSRISELIEKIKSILLENGSVRTTLTDNDKNAFIDSIINQDPSKVNQSSGDASTLLLANVDFFIAEVVAYIELTYGNPQTFQYDNSKCIRDVEFITRNVSDDLLLGGDYNCTYAGLSYFSRSGTHHLVTLEENLTDSGLIPDGAFINFYQRSYMSASGYLFEYVGSGSNYGALPQVGRVDPIQSREVIQLDSGKVFFTSTDQNGDFRIGPGLVISQATGTLAGRTFQKSLFAEMTPFILALE